MPQNNYALVPLGLSDGGVSGRQRVKALRNYKHKTVKEMQISEFTHILRDLRIAKGFSVFGLSVFTGCISGYPLSFLRVLRVFRNIYSISLFALSRLLFLPPCIRALCLLTVRR